MKKEILIFIFDGYADWESAYICSELNAPETDYIVKTLSFDKEPKISMGGFHAIPDYSINGYMNNRKHSSNTLEFTKEIMLYLNAKPEDKINEWYRFHKLGYYQS